MNDEKNRYPYGTISKLANILSISKQAVHQRLKRGDEYTIELLEKVLQDIAESKKRKKQAAYKAAILKQNFKTNGLS